MTSGAKRLVGVKRPVGKRPGEKRFGGGGGGAKRLGEEMVWEEGGHPGFFSVRIIFKEKKRIVKF